MLLSQYEQAWSDKRNYDQMIWQTPTISLGIVAIVIGGLLGCVSKYRGTFLVPIIISFALGVVLIGIVQLRKHHFFQNAIVRDLERIQVDIRDLVPEGHDIKFRTGQILGDSSRYSESDVPRSWLATQSAYHWFYVFMWMVFVVLLLLDLTTLPHYYH